MDNKEWVQVYSTNVPHQADIVKQMLESNGLEAVVVNKQDSSYLTFGEAEVYVLFENVEIAKKLIEES